MITDVAGVTVGHWTDLEAATGCTVVLFPPGTTGARALVGGAPATREVDLLDPASTVQEVHAFVIGGGSAYGLGAADGVQAFLEEHGVGFPIGPTVVPLVPGACLFDLSVGDHRVRPGPREGRAAAEAAGASFDEGSVGAGAGATVAKWAGREFAMKGGLGSASRVVGDVVVGAVVACNAVGDVLDERGDVLAGARAEGPQSWAVAVEPSTVLTVVATNARLDKGRATHAARMAAVGVGRCVRPAHTPFDGDIVLLAATNAVDADPGLVGAMGAEAVADALRRGVRLARGLAGVPGLAG